VEVNVNICLWYNLWNEFLPELAGEVGVEAFGAEGDEDVDCGW
jgi:hypothetical protein